MKKLRITVEGKVYEVEVEVLGARAAAPVAAGAGDVVCPLAATVVAVNVKEGQAVKEGDLLVTLEAMKMSTPINSDRAGTVSKIYVSAGQSVQEGQPLIAIA